VCNGLWNDPVTMSVWQWPAIFWIRDPLTGVGAMLVTVSLTPFLANGVTRREYLAGAGVFGIAVCAIAAVITVVGFAGERLVYILGGFERELVPQAPLEFGIVYLLLLAAYLATGTLMGALLGRFSPWVAPFLITFSVVPMLGGEMLLGTWWGGIEKGQLRDSVPLALGGPLVVTLIAIAAAVAFVLVRDIAIRPKKG
jgi:hypothetical protein